MGTNANAGSVGRIYALVIGSVKNMGRDIYRLWGLSLLGLLLSALALCLGVIPAISLPLILVLSLGVILVTYEGYLGGTPDAERLFVGFKSGFKRNCCGMAWLLLWLFIWALIPVAGVFIAVHKAYAYRFAPYILLTRPEVSATEALRLSVRETRGYKGLMFAAEILIVLAVALVALLLSLLGLIPLVGWFFRALLYLVLLLFAALLPLLYGLLGAAFYDEAHGPAGLERGAPETEADGVEDRLPGLAGSGIPEAAPNSKPDEGAAALKFEYCPNCGAPLTDGQLYCGNCGLKIAVR